MIIHYQNSLINVYGCAQIYGHREARKKYVAVNSYTTTFKVCILIFYQVIDTPKWITIFLIQTQFCYTLNEALNLWSRNSWKIKIFKITVPDAPSQTFLFPLFINWVSSYFVVEMPMTRMTMSEEVLSGSLMIKGFTNKRQKWVNMRAKLTSNPQKQVENGYQIHSLQLVWYCGRCVW